MVAAWNKPPLMRYVDLNLFLWQIVGSFLVYTPVVNYDPESPDYCDKWVYRSAFWTVTFLNIILGCVVGFTFFVFVVIGVIGVVVHMITETISSNQARAVRENHMG